MGEGCERQVPGGPEVVDGFVDHRHIGHRHEPRQRHPPGWISEVEDDGASAPGDQWRELSRPGLMRRKLPEQLEIVAALPRTELGKIAKNQLRERFDASAG